MSGVAPWLRASSSFAILVALASAVPSASAQTTISSSQSTPVSTSTTGDLTIGGSGTITTSGTGAAVAVNSNNSVTNTGTITVNDGNNAQGILVTGGFTGTITNNLQITVTDSTLASTLPLTQGENRYGIEVNSGTGPFSGGIDNVAGATITVRGNDSAGIFLTQPTANVVGGITGSIVSDGNIGLTGDRSFGILAGGNALIQGGVSVTGVITSLGQGAGGIELNGGVYGSLYIDNVVRSTGYFNGAATVARPASFTGITASNMLQGGSAVSIGNSIGAGIEVDTDGSVQTYGSAPALVINGSGTTETEIGTTSNTTYGLIVNGTVRGNGIYDGVSGTAMQIGGSGSPTVIDNGISVVGSVKGNAFAANSTGIVIGAGGVVPVINNLGLIQATSQFGVSGTGITGTATAISVASGGSLSMIENKGVIQAAVGGTAADIVSSQTQLDFFGTTIGTPFVPPKTADVSTQANALDLSNDIVPVTVQQDPSGTSTASAITGNILFGPAGATLNLYSGTVTGAVTYGLTSNNTLVIGQMANGSTAGSSALLGGALSVDTGGTLAVDIENGRLASTSTGTLPLSSLTITGQGQLDFAVDPSTGQNGGASVAAIVLSTGAKVGLDIDSPVTAPQTFTIIQTTGTATLVGQPTVLLGNIPYFYDAQVVTNTAAGTIGIAVDDRPFSQAGVVGNASAYDAIFKANYVDGDIRDTFNAAGTQQGFRQLYNQMLPQYSGGLFEILAQGADSLSRIQSDNPVAQNGNHGGGWTQEFGYGAVNGTDSAPGYHGGGLGFALGYEMPISKISAWGVSFSYMRASVDDFNTGPGNQQAGSVYTTGVYWHETDGGLHTDASVNLGVAQMNSIRNFAGVDLTGAPVTRTADANWVGGTGTVHAGLSYTEPVGDYFIKPSLSGDYFVLYQGGHNEHNGGDGFDLAYRSTTGKQGSVIAGLTIGTQYGDKFFTWRPELMVGYKQVFGGPDATVANFTGGSSFTLDAPDQKSGPVAHVGVHGGNKYSDFGFEAGGEDRGDYHGLDGRVVARFRF